MHMLAFHISIFPRIDCTSKYKGGVRTLIEPLDLFYQYALMSIALGLDAFSVSLGIGLQDIRLKKIAIIGTIVGLFHIILPFIGIIIGSLISVKLQLVTSALGGFILVFIGSYMFFSALKSESDLLGRLNGLKILSLSLIVSLDSFPVGLSLGISGTQKIFVIFLFGAVSMMLSWLGMLIGRKAHNLLSKYSEMLGGAILFAIGIHFIFKI